MKFKIEIEAEGVDELNALIRGLGNIYPNHSGNPLKVSDMKPVLHTGGTVKVDNLPFVGEKVFSTPVKVDAVSTTKIPSDTSGLPFDVTVSDSLPSNAAYIQTSDKPGDFKRVDMSTPIETGDGQQLTPFIGVDLTSEDDKFIKFDNEINLGGVHTIDVSSGVELDVNGLPWDERIHASTKAKLASGAWRSRRGVSDELVKQVEAELRGSPAPVVADTPLEQAIAEATEPVAQTASVSEYQTLVQTINNLMASGAIKFDYLTTLVKAIDEEFLDVTVNSITDIMNDAEMIEFAFEQLRTDGKIS